MSKIYYPDINPLHIKCLIAKTIKDATGKGPIDTQVTMLKDFIVAKFSGHLPMADLQMAQNHNEFLEVKNYHHKRARVFKENLLKDMEVLLQRPIDDFFYDINPINNQGMMIFLLEVDNLGLKDISALETQIAREVAKSIKDGCGRGPEDTQVCIKDKIVLVKTTGYLLPNEVQMAETDQGYHDVKLNRMKWFYLNREKTMEDMSRVLGKKVTDFFFDINPRTNVGVGVFIIE